MRNANCILKLASATTALAAALALANSAQGQTAPPACTGEASTSKVDNLTIERCLSTATTGTGIEGGMGDIYGWVALDSTEAVNVKSKNNFLKAFLGALAGFKEEQTTLISVVLSRNISGVDTVIFDKPLLEIRRVAGSDDQVSVSGTALSGGRISPYFVPDSGSADVTARVKFSVVENSSGRDLIKAREGLDPGTAVMGSVISGIGELPYAVIVNRLYLGLLTALSKSTRTSTDVGMSFDSSSGYKTARFGIALDATGASKAGFTLRIKGRKSLITDKTNTAGLLDLTSIEGTRFADKINIVDPAAPRVITLSTYLDADKIPRTLTDLGPGGAAAKTDKDAVDAACRDLRRALFSSPVKLSVHDARLVLYSELKWRGVFDRYNPRELGCTSDLVQRWKSDYAGLTIPDLGPVKVPTALVAKNNRLGRLATAWDNPEADTRSSQLQDNIAGSSIEIVAPADLFPNPGKYPEADGRIRQDLSGPGLGLRQKKCFGNFKPSTPETLAEATAFAQFVGFEPSYLVKIGFDDSQPFDAQFGPRIKSLDIKVADDTDKIIYNQKSSGARCF